MKRGNLIMLMTLVWGNICAQSLNNMEPGTLGFERKLTDALIGNELTAQAAFAEHLLIGFHFENKYSIRQANAAAVGIILPQKNNAITIGAATEGTNFFRNWKINIGEALKLQNNMSVGLKLFALGTQIKNEKDIMSIGYQVGMTYKLSTATNCHFHFTNTRPLNTGFDFNLQGLYQIQGGVAQQINQDVLVACDFNQEKGSYLYISPGLVWKIKNRIQLLLGLKSNPGEVYMGIGWSKNKSRMMIIMQHHPYLGNSLGIRYIFEKE